MGKKLNYVNEYNKQRRQVGGKVKPISFKIKSETKETLYYVKDQN